MNAAATPYLLYTGGTPADGGSPEAGASLAAQDRRLAQLFDGRRDYAAVAAAVRETGLPFSAAQAEGLAARLAESRLLRRGRLQPLPVPAFTDAEARGLGWFGGPVLSPAMQTTGALPPSSMPGSLANPGLIGGLGGRRRGQAQRIAVEFSSAAWLRLGALLNWPLYSRGALWLLFALISVAAFGLWQSRIAVGTDFARSFAEGHHLLTALVATYLASICSQLARAAAIARWTPSQPRLGFAFTAYGIPLIVVDSGGAAERADHKTRVRIVGAVLTATAVLALACAFLWLLFRRSNPGLAQIALISTSVSVVSLLLRLNPLSPLDGYHLIAQWLNAPDLRAQALFALFGRRRPWMQQRPLNARALQIYALLSALFVLLVALLLLLFPARWLSERFGGTGVLIFLAIMGSVVYSQFRKLVTPRSTLGRPPSPPLIRMTRTRWIIAGVALAVALIPYRFEPSGDFRVLPRDRADIRALVSGDVREVLAQEGAQVEAGQVIARLSDDAARSAYSASEAEVAQLKATLSAARKGGRNEEVELARSRVDTARKKFQVSNGQAVRLEGAYKRKSVTAADYERVRGYADVDRQTLLEAERALDLVKTPAQDDRIAAIEAQLKAAQAEQLQRKAELDATRIASPIAGRIVSRTLQFARGNYLNRGELLATVEDTGELYAEVLLPETAIGEVKLGAGASAKPWAFPASGFGGVVTRIAPNAEVGPYGKVVRVLVRIRDPEQRLMPEMTGSAKIEGGRYPLIYVYTRALIRFLLVEVWSWLP